MKSLKTPGVFHWCCLKSFFSAIRFPSIKHRRSLNFFSFQHEFVDWTRTHNTRNFSANADGDSACIWECLDNHLGSIFALTRQVDSILTCSCGYPGSFDLDKMVTSEFCHVFEQVNQAGGGEQSDYYDVHCVSDLDDGTGGPVRTL